MPPVPLDEYETADHLRLCQREMQHESSAHGVAEIGRVAAPIGDELRAGTEVGLDGGRLAMAGGVDAHDFVVEREIGGHGTPAVAILGEPVHEHEPRPMTVDLRVKHVTHTCTKMDGWRTLP